MILSSHQRGFSLIEVLVAVVILSLGFAGYAALQVIGIKSVDDSYIRSQMTILSEELVERMRSNREALGIRVAGQSDYHDLGYDGDDSCSDSGGAAEVIADLACEDDGSALWDETCTADEMARYDVARVFCGYEGGGRYFGGMKDVALDAEILVTCNEVGGACPAGTPHTVTASWSVPETDQNPDADQDDDGDDDLMTQTIQIVVVP